MNASYLDGRQIVVDGQEYLYFYGTSYLGLPYDKEFHRLLVDGQNKYGSSLGSSPMSIPRLSIYSELEECLADRYGFEDALLFASGYATAQAVVGLFNEQDYKIEYGKIAHPALKLEKQIQSIRNEEPSSRSILHAVDYIDPITFEKFETKLVSSFDDKLLIDVSHGFGLFDDEISSDFKSENTMLCGSLNKALGINAGVLLCKQAMKKQLENSSRYKTASAPSPSECYALLVALKDGLVKIKQDKLKDHMIKLAEIGEGDARCISGFPVVTFRNNSQNLYDYFQSNGLYIWRNRYPTSDSPMVNRAVITAAHQVADLDKLISLLKGFKS